MFQFPQTPEAGGAMLAAYLAAETDRRPVFDNIVDRLTPDGRVGIITRFYVIRCAHRRMIYRGVLTAIGAKLPSWVIECPEAAASNRAFVARYRSIYNAYRVSSRTKAASPTTPIAKG